MKEFIPYEKLSKKKKRELNIKNRSTWGELNPVTRRPDNPKAYNRKKTQNRKDYSDFVSFVFMVRVIEPGKISTPGFAAP